jgi:hypothetical protein
LLAFGWASPAAAHGFGQRYDLPLPLSFYVWGAGATVALSFLGFAFFLPREGDRTWHTELPVSEILLRGLRLIARAFAVVLFLLAIAAGFTGTPDPTRNIAPVTVWVIGWVGIAFLSLCFGHIWRWLNPWDSLYLLAQKALGAWRGPGTLQSPLPYPAWLDLWPAFLLFVAFTWMELVWEGKAVPQQLATALTVYSLLTWTGMILCGRETWLRRGEIFELVFGILARFAPLAKVPRVATIRLRLPGAGLLDDAPRSIAMVALTIALLATVTFDGFLETPVWARIDAAVLDAASEMDSVFWTVFGLREDQSVQLVRTAGLIACVLLFIAVYAAICWLSLWVSRERGVGTRTVLYRFAFTLIPIAAAYHVAHYFSLLVNTGQYAIPLLSDPFGRGWNLFGTETYRPAVLVEPSLQWTVALAAVVIGHVIAVCLAHVAALRLFPSRRAALLSQAPMVLLMIGYTMVSLWILSQPIVEASPR